MSNQMAMITIDHIFENEFLQKDKHKIMEEQQ